MSDRELLEKAAMAAGISVHWGNMPHQDDMLFYDDGGEFSPEWNPLTDDGDALRLAVNLGLEVSCDGAENIIVGWPDPCHAFSKDDCVFYSHVTEPKGSDPCAATRRAIVRAAASLCPTLREE